MAGIQYNGAIEVRPCEFVNIPEPGILVDVFQPVYTAGLTSPTITGFTIAEIEALKENKVGGGDVVYLTDTTGKASLNPNHILEIEKIEFDVKGVVTIFLKDLCNPPNVDFSAGNCTVQIYRGNYSTTNGSLQTPTGYTGAGNSEGYSLYCSEAATLKVLTVNNDLIDIAYPDKEPLDLLVVKVLEIVSGAPTITALKVQQ